MDDGTLQILVLDDDYDIGQFIVDSATEHRLKSLATTTVPEFFDYLTSEVSLIFLDLVIPHIDGLEVLSRLGKSRCVSQIVIMSGADDLVLETVETWSMQLGLDVVGHLQKPIRLSSLETFFRCCLE
jgi:DNA-binding response OmpR family regulator